MTSVDLELLICSPCGGGFSFEGSCVCGELQDGCLRCTSCGREVPVKDGVPDFVDDRQIRGVEWLMRLIYDNLAVLHDPVVHVVTPLFQSISEQDGRDRYMERLDLADLEASDCNIARILEIGIGTGGNLPVLARHLPGHLNVELWGLDLSAGMLALCRQRLVQHPEYRPVRLLLADAHELPFPDCCFDRVFHTGGIATYRDPRRGLAEMARVAKPKTPIVVVDEQLDPTTRHGVLHRLAFRALTFYDRAPAAPVEHLPDNAAGVLLEQISNFYYCLTFRMPQGTAPGYS